MILNQDSYRKTIAWQSTTKPFLHVEGKRGRFFFQQRGPYVSTCIASTSSSAWDLVEERAFAARFATDTKAFRFWNRTKRATYCARVTWSPSWAVRRFRSHRWLTCTGEQLRQRSSPEASRRLQRKETLTVFLERMTICGKCSVPPSKKASVVLKISFKNEEKYQHHCLRCSNEGELKEFARINEFWTQLRNDQWDTNRCKKALMTNTLSSPKAAALPRLKRQRLLVTIHVLRH